MATVHIPTRINFGCGISTAFSIEGKKALCLISQSVNANTQIGKSIKEHLLNNGGQLVIIERAGSEPSSDEVDHLVDESPDDIDAVIAVGGGSVLDIAKYVAMLKVSRGKCTDYEFASNKISGALPTFMIPTTSGSGSEATQYSVIQNSVTRRKFTIASPLLFPEAAYIDPELTIGLPLQTSFASGLDAFIHCLEAYLNTSSNPIIRPLAIEGMRLGYTYLPQLVKESQNLKIRTKLSLSSIIGGMCIANSRTGLIHTLSVAISEYSQLAHGIINAKMLPHALRYNAPYFSGELVEVVRSVMGVKATTDSEAVEILVDWIESILGNLELKIIDGLKLRRKISHLVERIRQDKQLPNINHGPINDEVIKSLIEEISSDAK